MALCTLVPVILTNCGKFHEPAHVAVSDRGHFIWDWRAVIRSYVYPLPLIFAFQFTNHFRVLLGFQSKIGFEVEDFIVQAALFLLEPLGFNDRLHRETW